MVEYDLPKVGAEGSIPFSRSFVAVRRISYNTGLFPLRGFAISIVRATAVFLSITSIALIVTHVIRSR